LNSTRRPVPGSPFGEARRLKATLLCGYRIFKYSHPKCAAVTKIYVKARKIGI
jgi:hypothetical protein